MVRPRNIKTIALAGVCIAIGIAIGLWLPRGTDTPPLRPNAVPGSGKSTAGPNGRGMFSPDISNDPFVRQEQLKVVEMLEQQCRSSGKDCALAKAAREALDRN
ncbi:hypothetical protein [Sphingomonas koreensis]|uniref:hypothetical protein n=1 Tax=Sphingomonas koreensis TaxID=93064 RepID=UPI000F7DF1A0|nr:hypothetical protein [Sphingomonas koreensis]